MKIKGVKGAAKPSENLLMRNLRGEAERKKVYDWLVLFYGGGYNNLSDNVEFSLNELETVGSNDKVKILALASTKKHSDLRVYDVKRDDKLDEVTSEVVWSYKGFASDEDNLRRFIIDSMRKYPAKHVALFISGHGFGWKGLLSDEFLIFLSKKMSISELSEALDGATRELKRGIDILAFDACLMGMAEVMYAIRPYAKYLLASEAVVGGGGFPYGKVVRALTDTKGDKPSEVAKRIGEVIFSERSNIIDAYLNYLKDKDPSLYQKLLRESLGIKTLAVVDTSKLEKFIEAFRRFSERVLKASREDLMIMREALYKALKLSDDNTLKSMDLGTFLKAVVESDISDRELKVAAEEALKRMKESLIFRGARDNYSDASGIAVNYEVENSGELEVYKELPFEKRTRWLEALKRILTVS